MTLRELGEALQKSSARQCAGLEYRTFCGVVDAGCVAQGKMVLRLNVQTKELFWGCTGYPKCTATKPFFFELLPQATPEVCHVKRKKK